MVVPGSVGTSVVGVLGSLVGCVGSAVGTSVVGSLVGCVGSAVGTSVVGSLVGCVGSAVGTSVVGVLDSFVGPVGWAVLVLLGRGCDGVGSAVPLGRLGAEVLGSLVGRPDGPDAVDEPDGDDVALEDADVPWLAPGPLGPALEPSPLVP